MAAAVAAAHIFVPSVHAQDGHETRVGRARVVDSDDARVSVDDAWLRGAPEETLAGALGATLVHDGGPLAPVRPMLRGLAGARIAVTAGGLMLMDPATGLLDASLWPWAATDAVVVASGAGEGLGGQLSMELLRGPLLRGRVLVGSASTARASVAAADETVLVAMDAGTTGGDFAFVPTSAVAGPVDRPERRANNDRKRGSALLSGQLRLGELDVVGTALAAGHSGGIPGFAASPTRGLRGEDAVVGARVAATLREGPTRVGVSAQGRAAHRATFGPHDARSSIDSGAGRAQASFAMSSEHVQLEVVSGTDHAALLGADIVDIDAAGFARTAVDVAGTVGTSLALGATVLRLRGAVDGRLTTDAGGLWGGELRAEVGETVRAFAGMSRASRAPTLDELYAPRGIVLGNPSLRPEALADVEVGGAVLASRVVEARLVAFAGRIEDAIVYVNKNPFEIAPANLGAGWRVGIDAAIAVEPARWIGLRVGAGVLSSRMEATGGPLPLAPPFASTLSLRTGTVTGTTATAVVRSRAAAPSNAFGTLKAASYTLVDLLVRTPITDNLALGCAVENALDALDARDANGLPLPGRLFFLSLEVSG